MTSVKHTKFISIKLRSISVVDKVRSLQLTAG
jgi:hypothetical protein